MTDREKLMELMREEKKKLSNLIAPAIEQFVLATGIYPSNIKIQTTTNKTRCGDNVVYEPIILVEF